MEVLLLTVLLSLVLVGIFLFLFLASRREDGFGGPERQSLLPLEEDTAIVPSPIRPDVTRE